MENLIETYQKLGISQTLDYDKFNHIAIVHHSTAIEGCTLTEVETSVLLHDGLTPRGKPLSHSLMVKDHFDALQFVLAQAKQKKPLTIKLIQHISAKILKNTGLVYKTILGDIDASQGQFRKGNVYAGESYFPSYEKVPQLMDELIRFLQTVLSSDLSLRQQLDLSFDVHFKLVSIHPFYDGNGRTARLLMNYIQHYYALPLSIIPVQSRADYFQALIDSRKQHNMAIFREYMAAEYRNQLQHEIDKFKRDIRPSEE